MMAAGQQKLQQQISANLRFSDAKGSSFLSEALCLGFSLSP
jgi:hypothetical protein